MKRRLLQVMEWLQDRGVDYADARFVDLKEEEVATENERLITLNHRRSQGVGIRVLDRGAPGFACTQNLEDLQQTAKTALAVARASQLLQQSPICLAPKEVVTDSYGIDVQRDPFTVPREEKLELLLQAEAAMKKQASLFKTSGKLYFSQEKKIYVDTEGSCITQQLPVSGGGIEAVVVNDEDMQKRSYPTSFGGNYGQAGYEFIADLGLVERAPELAQEVTELLRAPLCPSGIFDVILLPSQMALQIHESVGHPVELDRVFGSEAAFAGTSFLQPSHITEEFPYGSRHINIVADATVPQGLGTFGYDDEGVRGQRCSIIEGGIFKGFLSCRETASLLGGSSNGSSRAHGWQNIPLIRMTNINLLPGDHSLDALIHDIQKGMLFKVNKSWSIDDKRINFQFGCEVAYEIRNGQLTGQIFKNPVYEDTTTRFWGRCDGVANEDFWELYGVPNCGKGEPMQTAMVGHGSSPARFRGVKVGVASE